MAERLIGAFDWLAHQPVLAELRVGLFGASTGAAAALRAAVERPDLVRAVVSRGGRPDLADAALGRVLAPVRLIVGELDQTVLELNIEASAKLRGTREIRVEPGATHLFEELGALEAMSKVGGEWFERYL